MTVRVPVAPSPEKIPSLWRHQNFLYFWTGQSVSMLGSAVSLIAMPLVGVLLLKLNAIGVGIIASAAVWPRVFIGPFIGPLVDRLDRRKIMIASDVLRALITFSVPIAVLLHGLTFLQLVVVSGALGLLSQLFDVAQQTFLPSVVAKASIGEGNSKLEATSSVADMGGPGIAGLLMGLAGPAAAVTVDAASYFVSAGSLLLIRGSRKAVIAEGATPRQITGFWANVKSGNHILWQDPVLRSVCISYSVLCFFAQLQNAVYMLFLVRSIHFSATLIGVVFSLSGAAGFISAMVSGKLTDRIGVGGLIVAGQTAMVIGGVALACVAGSKFLAAGLMLISEAAYAVGLSFYGVGNRTLMQTRVDDEVRGRVIGASKFLTNILIALSGVAAGALGAAFGLRVALVVGAVGMALTLALILRPQVWSVSAD